MEVEEASLITEDHEDSTIRVGRATQGDEDLAEVAKEWANRMASELVTIMVEALEVDLAGVGMGDREEESLKDIEAMEVEDLGEIMEENLDAVAWGEIECYQGELLEEVLLKVTRGLSSRLAMIPMKMNLLSRAG